MTIERIGPPLTAGEREMLRTCPDYRRAALALTRDGRSSLRREGIDGTVGV